MKDDENPTDQAFNPYADRLTESLAARNRAEEQTGETTSYRDGAHAGAKALRATVDAAAAGETIADKAEEVPGLATALETWGTETPW